MTSIPYFVQTPERELSRAEARLVQWLVNGQTSRLTEQIAELKVRGRCGCGDCPTIFFLDPAGEDETDVAQAVGQDASGGMTGVALMASKGRLSQLEFYSIDGHTPLSMPSPDSLVRQ